MKARGSKSKVLVTGGTGYIGSHACVSLIEAGYEPIIYDNLCNSSLQVTDRIKEITGQRPRFLEGDIRDQARLDNFIRQQQPHVVMHFAGLKAVGESVREPELYQANNVEGTASLLAAMQANDLHRLVFSSSATVYGIPDTVPITESAQLRATNPYGQNKLDIERMLEALQAREPEWHVACLRYFNPVGAHPSGLIGEDPRGTPNNLMPFIAQVAVGRRDRLQVFGGDYDTVDGTGVRDYIHVMDLAEGHVAALNLLDQGPGLHQINLGTGRGVSVIEMVRAFERASGQPVPFDIVARRVGDSATCWADPALAGRLLGWQAGRTLEQMCEDAWRWQKANPSGYNDS